MVYYLGVRALNNNRSLRDEMSTTEITDKDRYASVTISKEELLKRKRPDRPVWQMVGELLKEIPVEDLERMPTDGAEQHDHYIYGTPKRIP